MYFVIKQAKNKQYYFVLKSGNHQVVLQSEMYTTKAAAKSTIESIKNGVNAKSEVKDETVE